MSLDIYLKGELVEESCHCESCGNDHTSIIYPRLASFNFTHNLGKMAKEAGIYEFLWRSEENGIFFANQLIQPLIDGIAKMIKDPKFYQSFNPANGWGSYDGFVKRLDELLEACKKYPEARIETCR